MREPRMQALECCGPSPRPTSMRIVSGTLDWPTCSATWRPDCRFDPSGDCEFEPHVGHDRPHSPQDEPSATPPWRSPPPACRTRASCRPWPAPMGSGRPNPSDRPVALEADVDRLLWMASENLSWRLIMERDAEHCRLSSSAPENGLLRANATASSISTAISASTATCAASSIMPSSSSTLRYRLMGQRADQASNSSCERYPRCRSPRGPQCSSQR